MSARAVEKEDWLPGAPFLVVKGRAVYLCRWHIAAQLATVAVERIDVLDSPFLNWLVEITAAEGSERASGGGGRCGPARRA